MRAQPPAEALTSLTTLRGQRWQRPERGARPSDRGTGTNTDTNPGTHAHAHAHSQSKSPGPGLSLWFRLGLGQSICRFFVVRLDASRSRVNCRFELRRVILFFFYICVFSFLLFLVVRSSLKQLMRMLSGPKESKTVFFLLLICHFVQNVGCLFLKSLLTSFKESRAVHRDDIAR